MKITEQAVRAAEEAVYLRHERGFLIKPLIDPIDMRAALTAALPYLHPVDVAAVQEAISSINIHDEANSYEWRGDGDYTPNEQEKALLEDFGNGLVGAIEDAIRSLSAEPAQGEQWQPIETAPKDGTDVLLKRTMDRPEIVGGYFDGEWRSFDQPDKAISDVTHWMPLPAAPTAEAGR